MKNARLVVATSADAEFVWTQVEADKWVERFYKLDDDEWSLIHRVEFLTEEMVTGFAIRLQAIGFSLTIA